LISFNSSNSPFQDFGTNKQSLSLRANEHLLGTQLFLHTLGFEWRHPNVWDKLSNGWSDLFRSCFHSARILFDIFM